MSDYTLHYWPLPFRGQFVRAVLAHVGASWTEAGFDATKAQAHGPLGDQACPHMGPPVLTDHGNGVTLSQTPAILQYLGDKYGLIPEDPSGAAMTQKVIADANDVLSDMTRANGAQMWTGPDWSAFQPRLCRWMQIFELTGSRNGLSPQQGYILGTNAAGIADLVVATLWGTMTDRFTALRPVLDHSAPCIAGLTDRIAAQPEQMTLSALSRSNYGGLWCGGQIESSLRAVLPANSAF